MQKYIKYLNNFNYKEDIYLNHNFMYLISIKISFKISFQIFKIF